MRDQYGYTLVELIITVAIGALLMSVLGSVVLTAWQGVNTATGRIEASGQIRNFAYFAYPDFTRIDMRTLTGCPASPVTQIQFTAWRAGGQAPVQVTYTYDGASVVSRQITGAATKTVASNVSSLTCSTDSSSAFTTLVLTVKVQVQSISQSQTFRFEPRSNP